MKHVVVFSGGRGGATILQALQARKDLRVTVLINGYDDGLSTGLIRQAFPWMQGPSDFRKVAHALGNTSACQALEQRVSNYTLGRMAGPGIVLVRREVEAWHAVVADFLRVSGSTEHMVVGNLLMTALAQCHGGFQPAVDRYALLCGVPWSTELVAVSGVGLLLGVTKSGIILSSEAQVTDAPSEIADTRVWPEPAVPAMARGAVDRANLIVLAPGTYHSSIRPTLQALSRHGLQTCRVVMVANATRDSGMGEWSWKDLLDDVDRAVGAGSWGPYVDWLLLDHLSELNSVPGDARVHCGNFVNWSTGKHDGEAIATELMNLL